MRKYDRIAFVFDGNLNCEFVAKGKHSLSEAFCWKIRNCVEQCAIAFLLASKTSIFAFVFSDCGNSFFFYDCETIKLPQEEMLPLVLQALLECGLRYDRHTRIAHLAIAAIEQKLFL